MLACIAHRLAGHWIVLDVPLEAGARCPKEQGPRLLGAHVGKRVSPVGVGLHVAISRTAERVGAGAPVGGGVQRVRKASQSADRGEVALRSEQAVRGLHAANHTPLLGPPPLHTPLLLHQTLLVFLTARH